MLWFEDTCCLPLLYSLFIPNYSLQRQISARALMPPPRPPTNSLSRSIPGQPRLGSSSSKKISGSRVDPSRSDSRSRSSFGNAGNSTSRTGHSSNLSSNSDAHKPRRKRRPKKKKQQVCQFSFFGMCKHQILTV